MARFLYLATLPLLLCTLATLGCDSDSPPEPPEDIAREIGEQSPDTAEISEDKCDTAAPAGVARVREACTVAGKITPYFATQPEDLFLENSSVRYVLRIGDEAGLVIMGSGPGGIVDALPAVDGAYQQNADKLLEFIIFPGFRTLSDTSRTHGVDPESGAAFVQIEGKLAPLPIIHEVLPILGLSGSARLTWTLKPDSPVLDLEVEVTPEGSGIKNATLALLLMHSGTLDTYIPEQGLGGGATGKGTILAGVHPEYSIGFSSDQTMSFLEAGGLTLVIPETKKATSSEPAISQFKFAVVGAGLGALMDALKPIEEQSFAVDVEVFSQSPFPQKNLLLEYGKKDGPTTGRQRIRSDGGASLQLPEGAYWFTAIWENGPRGVLQHADIQAGENETIKVALPAAALFSLTAEDEDTPGALIPARAMVTSTDGAFGEHRALSPNGPTEILVPPGTYEIIMMRGPEYEAAHHKGRIMADGETQNLVGRLKRVVDSRGWVAADFHLHCEFSADSSLPIHQRVLEVAAEGLEFALSTDHDYIASYAPIRDDLNLGAFLAVADGVEASHPTLAHITSWPIEPDPGASGRGAPNWAEKTPGEIFSMLGDQNPDRIYQLNHARSTSGYFERTGYDPKTGMAARSPTSLGYEEGTPLTGFHYDSMEIYNGKRDEEFDALFTDWLSLIAQGFRPAATGTSDSHGSGSYPGSARTYVWVGEGRDDPSILSISDIMQGILAQRTLVVGGPFVEIWLMDAGGEGANAKGVGETLHQKGDIARVRVRIQAPSWMPVDQLQIYQNLEIVIDEPVPAEPTSPGSAVLVDKTWELPVQADSFFAVKVLSDRSAAPYLKGPIKSMAGPVYLDADGDGSFQEPGL